MNAKHTPGPWFVEDPLGNKAGDSLWIVQDGTNGKVYEWRNLAVVCSDGPDDVGNANPISVQERDANARLIKAAPDMLDALLGLKFILATAESNSSGMPSFEAVSAKVNAARAAIAKATGAA